MPDYWMRAVDFRRIAELFALVVASPGELRPADLDRVAISSGVFVSATGKPLGPTSRYHHRRTLERLAFVEQRNGRFVPTLTGSECENMLPGNNEGELNDDQRYIIGSRVVCNPDCYDVFWKAFMPSRRPSSLQEFVHKAVPIVLEVTPAVDGTRYSRSVSLRTVGFENNDRIHDGYKAVQAIHSGLRAWGTGQLKFLDKLYRLGEGYHVFAIDTFSQVDATSIERCLYETLAFHGDWAMPRISDLLLGVATRLRVPLDNVRSILNLWIRDHAGYVSPVAVSDRMILSGQTAQRRNLILDGYLTLSGGEYVSHLRVHRGLINRIQLSDDKETCYGT